MEFILPPLLLLPSAEVGCSTPLVAASPSPKMLSLLPNLRVLERDKLAKALVTDFSPSPRMLELLSNLRVLSAVVEVDLVLVLFAGKSPKILSLPRTLR